MLPAHLFALFFTVALMAITAYFLLGSVPLLTLKHDNPIDGPFVRSFYITYFKMAFVVALATAVSYGVAGRPVFAVGATAIAALTWWVRFHFVPRMDQLSADIQAQGPDKVPNFHAIHKKAILINTTQLMTILCSLGFF